MTSYNFSSDATWRAHCDDADAMMRAAMGRYFGIDKPESKIRKLPSNFNPVIATAAALANVTIAELLGPCRARHLTHSRFAIMVVYKRAGWSLPRIGRLLGDRDHTTIISGLRTANDLLYYNDFLALVDRLTAVYEASRL